MAICINWSVICHCQSARERYRQSPATVAHWPVVARWCNGILNSCGTLGRDGRVERSGTSVTTLRAFEPTRSVIDSFGSFGRVILSCCAVFLFCFAPSALHHASEKVVGLIRQQIGKDAVTNKGDDHPMQDLPRRSRTNVGR